MAPQGFREKVLQAEQSKVAVSSLYELWQSLKELSQLPPSQRGRTGPGSGRVKESVSESCIDITRSAAALRLASELNGYGYRRLRGF